MVVFENLLIIFISVIYALSLYCIVELNFKINETVKRITDTEPSPVRYEKSIDKGITSDYIGMGLINK